MGRDTLLKAPLKKGRKIVWITDEMCYTKCTNDSCKEILEMKMWRGLLRLQLLLRRGERKHAQMTKYSAKTCTNDSCEKSRKYEVGVTNVYSLLSGERQGSVQKQFMWRNTGKGKVEGHCVWLPKRDVPFLGKGVRINDSNWRSSHMRP